MTYGVDRARLFRLLTLENKRVRSDLLMMHGIFIRKIDIDLDDQRLKLSLKLDSNVSFFLAFVFLILESITSVLFTSPCRIAG